LLNFCRPYSVPFLKRASCLLAFVGLVLPLTRDSAVLAKPIEVKGSPYYHRFLTFTMQINSHGVIDTSGRGYYAFLINAFNTPIEVTDLDTFSDFVRFDGRSWDWFHRSEQLPRPGFQFFQAANLNVFGRIGTDRRTIEVVFDTGDSTNVLNQYLTNQRFTVSAMTCDNYKNAILGRPIDVLGQGPDITKNSLQTLQVRKNEGATQPLPQFYPVDPLGDFLVHPDLPPDYPYQNFDIARFEVTIR
jgi:hypothetical protein